MAVIATPIHNLSTISQLRAFNPARDAKAATDLVEMCFADTLDPDGSHYLQRLHDSAYRNTLAGWISPFEPASLPRMGYVWEEAGHLVGYLSLIPFQHQHQNHHLIANVSVHPDWRGRGIGRALTRHALEYGCQHRAKSTWLQVREENAPAVHIYRTEGFAERARRSTWVSASASSLRQNTRPSDDIYIRARRSQDWELQQTWLNAFYPAELAWHLPLDQQMFVPGLAGMFYRFLGWINLRHWVAQSSQGVRGILSCLSEEGYADTLWLALPNLENTPANNRALATMLRNARRETPRNRPLSLNLPASILGDALLESGFTIQQTLLWMECKF
jgi:ribosomal protein S18 acetylase RimI-like enzyme